MTTTYPGSTTETVTYDGVGNILTAKNRVGGSTSLAYDGGTKGTGTLNPCAFI